MTTARRPVLARIDVPGGEARVLASVVTERVLEVELGARLLRTTWDPRENGTTLVVDLGRWSSPEGEALDETDRAALLDALWAIAPESGGIREILTWERSCGAYVAWRWSREPDAHVLRVDDALDVMWLARTARIPCDRTYGPKGEPRASVDLAGARWCYPERGPVAAPERAQLRERIETSVPRDYVLTSFPWHFTFKGDTSAAG